MRPPMQFKMEKEEITEYTEIICFSVYSVIPSFQKMISNDLLKSDQYNLTKRESITVILLVI